MDRPTAINLALVQQWAREIADGDRDEIDLSALQHTAPVHGDLTALAVLSWWLLSASVPPVTIHLPGAKGSKGRSRTGPLRLLARSGLPFAAARRDCPLVIDDQTVAISDLFHRGDGIEQARLPNVDWRSYDDRAATSIDRLRVIPDLEDPRRIPPSPTSKGRRYQWVDSLGASAPLSASQRLRFDGDADRVIYEGISNVHKWSQCQRAIAACGVTTGGKSRKAGTLSWNRLHVVVMDDGIGIAEGLRVKRRREGKDPHWEVDVRDALQSEDLKTLDITDSTSALVYLLVDRAFGERPIDSTRDGHGLHTAGVMADQWFGHLEILTTDKANDGVVHVSRDRKSLETHSRLVLPLARGTLVHVVLNALVTAPDQPVVVRGHEQADLSEVTVDA